MSKAKFIQENGETILPITHEEAVLDNDGKNLPSKYQQKQDENLLTESKTIVGAINELSTKGGGGGEGNKVENLESFFALSETQFVSNANDISNIRGIYRTSDKTSNLPSVCYDGIHNVSAHGILITLTQYSGSEWGMQLFYSIDGNYTGATFNRVLWSLSDDGTLQATDWSLLKDQFIETDDGTILRDKIGNNELATTDKTLTGAINELFQNVDNGKNLIATSIGEPLSSEDTFSAMSNDINSLLSTFKTNMMNNGVSVDGSDRFKQLIDKLATLSDNEGKGVQFASETLTLSSTTSPLEVSNLTFNPDIVLIQYTSGNYLYTLTYNSFVHATNYYQFAHTSSGDAFYTRSVNTTYYINSTGFNLENAIFPTNRNLTWIAIGVGEEDSTLRDSLASILQEEGVTVSNEDDMASLISKVNSEFDRQVVPQGTSVASDVLSGKTFINSTGQLVTGSMTSHGTNTDCVSVNGTTQSGMLYVRIPRGAYLQNSSSGYPAINVADSNFVASNIVSGKSIFGLTGTAQVSSIATGTTTVKLNSTSGYTVSYNPGFKPSRLYFIIDSDSVGTSYSDNPWYLSYPCISSTQRFEIQDYYVYELYYIEITSITATSFKVLSNFSNSTNYSISWIAIP